MHEACKLPPMRNPAAEDIPGRNPARAAYRLQIYTLGHFTIVADGQQLRHGRKSPGKSLQLLKALIAFGGRHVEADNLAVIIWPGKEGELAQRALESTLHRLRKYLGDDRYLLLDDGMLTLNSDLVWVDVWDFERQLTTLRGLLLQPAHPATVTRISAIGDRLMCIYQGNFLSREQPGSWSVLLEECLRRRFVDGMLALGRFWEERGLPAKAVFFYQKGIVVDDLVETFYQRLMTCLDETGRQPEAIDCYRLCRHVLAVALGQQPTEETQQIYRSIISHHLPKAS